MVVTSFMAVTRFRYELHHIFNKTLHQGLELADQMNEAAKWICQKACRGLGVSFDNSFYIAPDASRAIHAFLDGGDFPQTIVNFFVSGSASASITRVSIHLTGIGMCCT